MFKMRVIIPIAIIASALSTFGVYKYLEKQKENIENTQVPYQTVMVANKTLPIGTKITLDDLEIKEWPVDVVPSGAFADTSGLVDRVVKMEIYSGEALMESKLAPKGSEGGFASMIPPGMRALTVSVNTYSGVSGYPAGNKGGCPGHCSINQQERGVLHQDHSGGRPGFGRGSDFRKKR
jgi:Flp pilus assembly protein CpaB